MYTWSVDNIEKLEQLSKFYREVLILGFDDLKKNDKEIEKTLQKINDKKLYLAFNGKDFDYFSDLLIANYKKESKNKEIYEKGLFSYNVNCDLLIPLYKRSLTQNLYLLPQNQYLAEYLKNISEQYCIKLYNLN